MRTCPNRDDSMWCQSVNKVPTTGLVVSQEVTPQERTKKLRTKEE
jgi:hypothetical protein